MVSGGFQVAVIPQVYIRIRETTIPLIHDLIPNIATATVLTSQRKKKPKNSLKMKADPIAITIILIEMAMGLSVNLYSKAMKKVFTFSLILLTFALYGLTFISVADAHRSGCHRWHSCPSDTGSYSCGDAGHPCQYPTYPKDGGVVYPPDGYYKDCYDCPLKKIPSTDSEIPAGGYQTPKVEVIPEVTAIPVVNSKNLAAQVAQDDDGSLLWWSVGGVGIVGAYILYRKGRKKNES